MSSREKVERIPTFRGLTFFRGDDSISQLDCRKFFRLDIFPPSGDPAYMLFSEIAGKVPSPCYDILNFVRYS